VTILLPSSSKKGSLVKRCYHCNQRFGLIRHRFALKQFCSKQCLNDHRADVDRRLRRVTAWTDFLSRKG